MAVGRSSSHGRVGTWARRAVQAGLIAGLVRDTVHLRRRLAGLRTLPPAAESPQGEPESDRLRVLVAENVRVDPATLASARAYAQVEGLVAVDLVPGNLPVAQALDLLRTVDPATYRKDRLALGRGAWHATLADGGVLNAAGISPQETVLSAGELVRAVIQLKLHAPAGTDLVVAPRLAGRPDVLAGDAEVIAALHGSSAAGALVPGLGWLGALGASVLFGRRWALVVLGAWSAQPLVVFAGSHSLCPADLWSSSARRLVEEPRRLVAARRALRQQDAGRSDPIDQRRPGYQTELAEGIERFFEPRRPDCPWCSSIRLKVRLRTRDLFQHKPGSFTLVGCEDCGHIFQNPRLTPAGLDFYYRDFYDGLGERVMDRLFRASEVMYPWRARSLQGLARPGSWLDVGTGHGHFCNAAREVWPQTTFDGLDIADGIKLAEHRGWVDRGHRGSFVDLSESLAGSYDVVSMFHYLEHSREPRQELQAAWTVLRPGGHLLIELPDPESRWGQLLGRWWVAWLQPQHLHFLPAGNLRRQLERMGFTVVSVQQAHWPIDLVWATWNRLSNLAGGQDLPWCRVKPPRSRRVVRSATLIAGTPAVLAAKATDQLLKPFAPRLGLSNAYLMVARKN